MIRRISNNKKAMIVLHEIYGINHFMEEICSEYHMQGFDVYCPNMLHRNCFTYLESSEAYQFFIDNVGFDYYKEVEDLAAQLKHTYDKVFVVGFSVGATIAWRCCMDGICDGIVCCYGSRIRDFLFLQPSCPTFLLFAEQDSFDVSNVIKQLFGKSNVEIHKVQASHGFMDQFSNSYKKEQMLKSKECIQAFLKKLI